MKRHLSVLLIVAMVLSSCQTKTKVKPSDINAAKVAVTKVLNAHWSAVKANDADAVIALLTDDVLSCGTDSKEFWNKIDLYNNIKQVFTDASLKTDITIDKREIRIAKDGKSAVAIEQMFIKPYSEKIPVRTIYHLVKVNNVWKIDFTSTGFIPNNEDIGKLNKALE